MPALVLVAMVAGLLTGLVVVGFRGALEAGAWLTGRTDAEDFDALDQWQLFLMPVFGALVIGLLLNRLPADSRRFGVVHVMEHLARHKGYMPWRRAVNQFLGCVAGLTVGLSGGREGPAVHIGAATSSLLGTAARLPDNSVRTLVGCGTAAAIGASFNTPMAGVIFAMEVVMMEYTMASFIPVIIAAVTATVVNRWFFGDVIAFSVPETELQSLFEIPYIALAGVAVGAVGAAFIRLTRMVADFDPGPFWLRAAGAGVVTGLAALVTPAVLGVGYDTVNQALLGQMAWTALLILLMTKIVASAACVGVGLPVGMIGPTLVIGATLGGLIGALGNSLAPGVASEPTFYVMLGMAAMMAAVLQAPLAALLAVLELTANPAIILPAMLMIVVASLTVTHVARQRSVFLAALAGLGLKYPPDPASQHLMRVGAAGLMSRSFVRVPSASSLRRLRAALAASPEWIVVEGPVDGEPEESGPLAVIAASDLSSALHRLTVVDATDESIDLHQIANLREATRVRDLATLLDALNEFRIADVDAVCVVRSNDDTDIVGVLAREEAAHYAAGHHH